MLDKEHPNTLISMNNLAVVLGRQGRYAEAERMHQQTLQLREKVLGKEHPDTLNSRTGLALVRQRIAALTSETATSVDSETASRPPDFAHTTPVPPLNSPTKTSSAPTTRSSNRPISASNPEDNYRRELEGEGEPRTAQHTTPSNEPSGHLPRLGLTRLGTLVQHAHPPTGSRLSALGSQLLLSEVALQGPGGHS